MPNWCGNLMIVEGDKQVLKDFIQKNIGYPVMYPEPTLYGPQKRYKKQFCFNALVPMPQDVIERGYYTSIEIPNEEFDKAYRTGKKEVPFLLDGYHWSLLNWGVGNDIINEVDENKDIYWESDKKISIFFRTAWSPPFWWFKNAAALYPSLKLHLSYMERGKMLTGDLHSENGAIAIKECTREECEKIFPH